MPPKKTKIDVAATNKQWLENGPEQKQLERMFNNKTIDPSAPPNKVRLSQPMFMEFPAKIFGAHYRKTKAKYGTYANNDSEEDDLIPELGSSKAPNNRQVSCSSTDNADCDSAYKANGDIDAVMEFNNLPFMTWTYTDREQKIDIVCVAVAVFSGSEDIHFSLSEDGMRLIIAYTWPSPLYSPSVLYKKKIDTNVMSLDHPEIYALAIRIAECEISEKAKPKGSMVIPLPQKVQQQVETWSKEGLKCNDSNIILLKFKAFQKKRVLQDADTSIITFS